MTNKVSPQPTLLVLQVLNRKQVHDTRSYTFSCTHSQTKTNAEFNPQLPQKSKFLLNVLSKPTSSTKTWRRKSWTIDRSQWQKGVGERGGEYTVLLHATQFTITPTKTARTRSATSKNNNSINNRRKFKKTEKRLITELQKYSSNWRRNVSINFTVVNKCNNELMDFVSQKKIQKERNLRISFSKPSKTNF